MNLVWDLYIKKTLESFDFQWGNLAKGQALLSDPSFRNNVDKIISQEELCIKPGWFKGRKVLDAGCGNGRWTYGFLKLGARVTAVDYSQNALKIVSTSLGQNKNLAVRKVNLLELPRWLKKEKFDLVFSWGVLHHTGNIRKALKNVAPLVKDDGVLYLYLYGKESLGVKGTIQVLARRTLLLPFSPNVKKKILSFFYPSDKIHQAFDAYATPLNERFEYEEVVKMLEDLGFSYFVRTIAHTEIFLKAYKSKEVELHFTKPKSSPYWFQKYSI